MAELVQRALLMEQVEKETWQKWQSLTPREQEVTALICIGYSTTAICEHLGIANETVRTMCAICWANLLSPIAKNYGVYWSSGILAPGTSLSPPFFIIHPSFTQEFTLKGIENNF